MLLAIPHSSSTISATLHRSSKYNTSRLSADPGRTEVILQTRSFEAFLQPKPLSSSSACCHIYPHAVLHSDQSPIQPRELLCLPANSKRPLLVLEEDDEGVQRNRVKNPTIETVGDCKLTSNILSDAPPRHQRCRRPDQTSGRPRPYPSLPIRMP